MQQKIWIAWAVFTLALMSVLGYLLFVANAKESLLIGEATHGHHQIELACEACHTTSFGGPEVLQQACESCHQAELDQAHDSHPKKKFTDPRNAELAQKLDATQCVTCHVEHQLEQTDDMGVTVPEDVCFHCHQQVIEQRETHQGLGFDTCASSGCHNFHDNRALYESFLVKNSGKPWLDYKAVTLTPNATKVLAPKGTGLEYIDKVDNEYPDIFHDWSLSSHASSSVGCLDCHQSDETPWQDSPEVTVCQTCHQDEFSGLIISKHGMRLCPELPIQLDAMTPKLGRLGFNDSAQNTSLTCSACHDPHKPDLQRASVESCFGCHNDQHSNAYLTSPHARAWEAEKSGVGAPNSGVTCATCYLPSEQHKQIIDRETRTKKVSVQHNQNATLRPNEKMIRPVCLQCHSLEFSIDALADEALILNNFNGKPSEHIESVDWALERDKR